jgi:hypothetical protein
VFISLFLLDTHLLTASVNDFFCIFALTRLCPVCLCSSIGTAHTSMFYPPLEPQQHRFVSNRIADFDDLLSTIPRVTRGAYVDALLLQQKRSVPAMNMGLSAQSQTSARDFSKRNRSCVNSLHAEGGMHTSLGSSFGCATRLAPTVTRDVGDAMLRKQREVERTALKQAKSPRLAAQAASSRRAY